MGAPIGGKDPEEGEGLGHGPDGQVGGSVVSAAPMPHPARMEPLLAFGRGFCKQEAWWKQRPVFLVLETNPMPHGTNGSQQICMPAKDH